MCGLIGVFSKEYLPRAEKKMLKELFVVTTLRGVDSTGMVYADLIKENRYNTMKSEGNFFDMVGNYPDAMMALSADLILGHCRWSTMGASNKMNAHPYDLKDFIAMHNGTLTDRKYDPKTYLGTNEAWKADRTDSYLFFRDLRDRMRAGENIDDVVKELKWSSAYAMVIWDLKSTVNVFRNRDRTLFIGVSEKNGTVVLSSEERFLNFVNNKELDLKIHRVEEHKLYKIDLKQVGDTKTPWIMEDMTKPTYPIISSNSGTYGGFYESLWGDGTYEDSDWYFDKKLGCYVERDEKQKDPRIGFLD